VGNLTQYGKIELSNTRIEAHQLMHVQ